MKLAIPGLLVEYLINGVVALIWLLPLVKAANLNINPIYLAPAVYVLGMLVDIVAFALVRFPKLKIRKRAERKRNITKKYQSGDNSKRKIKLELYAPDLAQEAERRSSRDRIARGTIINSIFSAIFVKNLPIAIPVVVFLLAGPMWWYFERSSYTYLLDAEKAIDEKLEREKM